MNPVVHLGCFQGLKHNDVHFGLPRSDKDNNPYVFFHHKIFTVTDTNTKTMDTVPNGGQCQCRSQCTWTLLQMLLYLLKPVLRVRVGVVQSTNMFHKIKPPMFLVFRVIGFTSMSGSRFLLSGKSEHSNSLSLPVAWKPSYPRVYNTQAMFQTAEFLEKKALCYVNL